MLQRNFFIRSIPNLFTSLNLLCGLLAVILAGSGGNYLVLAGYFIYVAAIFDFFDGFSARALKASSKMGKELDSLSDMVSFGVAPSMILFAILKESMDIKQFSFSLPAVDVLILLTPMLIAIFSALRLAKFNVDDRQKDKFLGIATPVAAMLIASIPLIENFDPHDLLLFPALDRNTYFFFGAMMLGAYIVKPAVIIGLSILLSILLVAEIPMFSLKFKSSSFEDNKLEYSFLIVSVVLFAIIQVLAIPLIFILYITFSFFNNMLIKSIKKREEKSIKLKEIHDNEE